MNKLDRLNHLDRLAQRQHCLLTTQQLRSAGLSDKQIHVRLARGELFRIRKQVLRTMGGPVTRHQAWLAAVLAAESDCVLGYRSGALLWGFKGFSYSGEEAGEEAIDLLTTEIRPRLAGVRPHLTRCLPGHHRTKVDHIPVTSAARTLVDACGLVSFRALEWAVDDALRTKKLHLPKLVRCAEEVPFSGRRKIRPIRLALADRVQGYDPGDSKEEFDVLSLLRKAGLPLPVQHFKVRLEGRTVELDYAWPETKHCLEYQGKKWHSMMSDFDRDYSRFRLLQRNDWTPWPLTKKTTANELYAIAAIATARLRAA